MKVILLPLFKFLWALFCSLTIGLIHVIFNSLFTIIYILWEFKFDRNGLNEIWNYKLTWRNHINWSPYSEEFNKDKLWTTGIIYKTIFHYIWGYKPIK